MKFNIDPSKAIEQPTTGRDLTGLAATLEQSRAQFEESTRPRKLLDFLTEDELDLLRMSSSPMLSTETDKVTTHNIMLIDTIVYLNTSFVSCNWQYTPGKLEISRDLWERKAGDYEYHLFNAIAQVLQYYFFGETERKFYHQLTFYHMGFDPLKYQTQRKELSVNVLEVIKNGKSAGTI